jgi:hypothetical protein
MKMFFDLKKLTLVVKKQVKSIRIFFFSFSRLFFTIKLELLELERNTLVSYCIIFNDEFSQSKQICKENQRNKMN